MKKLLFSIVTLVALAALLAGCGGSPSTTTTTPPVTTTTVTTTATTSTSANTGSGAQDGDTVSVNYIGTLQDGTKFDSSYDRGQPLTFVLGSGQMIPGFDAAVHGMKVGETKTVTLPPDQAYGEHLDSRVVTLDRTVFPEGSNLVVGQQVTLTNTSGQQMTGVITALPPGAVTVDLNSKYAGQTLTFEITLESITPAGG